MQQPLISEQPQNLLPQQSRKVLKDAKKSRKENRIAFDVNEMFKFGNQKCRELNNKRNRLELVKKAEEKIQQQQQEVKDASLAVKKKKLIAIEELEKQRLQYKDASIQDIKQRLSKIQEKNDDE